MKRIAYLMPDSAPTCCNISEAGKADVACARDHPSVKDEQVMGILSGDLVELAGADRAHSRRS